MRHFQEKLDQESDRLWDEGILDQEQLDKLSKPLIQPNDFKKESVAAELEAKAHNQNLKPLTPEINEQDSLQKQQYIVPPQEMTQENSTMVSPFVESTNPAITQDSNTNGNPFEGNINPFTMMGNTSSQNQIAS